MGSKVILREYKPLIRDEVERGRDGSEVLAKRISGKTVLLTNSSKKATPNNLVWAEIAGIGPARDACCVEHEDLQVGDVVGFDLSDTEVATYLDRSDFITCLSENLMARLDLRTYEVTPLGNHALTQFDEELARRVIGERGIIIPGTIARDGVRTEGTTDMELQAVCEKVLATGRGQLKRSLSNLLILDPEESDAVALVLGEAALFESNHGIEFASPTGLQRLVRAKYIHIQAL
jgi:hypothetical protein